MDDKQQPQSANQVQRPPGKDSGGGRRPGRMNGRGVNQRRNAVNNLNSQRLNNTMPGLTVDTFSPTSSSRSTSPTRPTYSPITPTLSAIDLSNPPTQNRNAPSSSVPQTFTHTTQASQTGIPQPSPMPIDFETNPDVLALKSTIAVLLMQERNAVNDMKILSSMKDRALADPEEFMRALSVGEIQSSQDPLLNPSVIGDEGDKMMVKKEEGKDQSQPWPKIPVPQNVARMPPVNWTQYGVVGESLDRLHRDQIERPSEGSPGKLGVDGNYTFAEGSGQRRESGLGIAAPYQPGRDKVEKAGKPAGKGKGGKR